jgi:hypothetical protein
MIQSLSTLTVIVPPPPVRCTGDGGGATKEEAVPFTQDGQLFCLNEGANFFAVDLSGHSADYLRPSAYVASGGANFFPDAEVTFSAFYYTNGWVNITGDFATPPDPPALGQTTGNMSSYGGVQIVLGFTVTGARRPLWLTVEFPPPS